MKKVILFIIIGVIVLGAGIGYRYYQRQQKIAQVPEVEQASEDTEAGVEEKLNEILQILQEVNQDLEDIRRSTSI